MLTTRLFKACAEIGNVCSRRLTSGAAIEYPLHRLQTVINHDVCQNLINNGFAVVDNVFGASYASILREEVQAVRDHMHLNCTHLVMNEADGGAAHRHLVPKSNIFEAELQDVNVQRLAPTCALLQTDPTLRVMIGLFLPQSRFSSHAIKLQWNAGGDCTRGFIQLAACTKMHSMGLTRLYILFGLLDVVIYVQEMELVFQFILTPMAVWIHAQ